MNRRNRILGATTIAAVAALAVASCSPQADTGSDDSYSVGVLVIVQAQLLDDLVGAFTETVQSELGDATVEFDIQNANGDQSLITSIARDFASSDYDAFAVAGTPAVIALAAQVTDRPIFALAMGDPVGAGVAESLEEPGGNVTGSIDFIDPALLLDDIVAIHPDAESIGTLYDPSNQNMQVWMEALTAAADDAGLTVAESTIATTAEVAQSARSLVDRADVVLIGPDASVIAGLDAVGAAMSNAAIPLYVAGGDAAVPGVLGSIGPEYTSLGVSAGVNAAAVLLGADVATTPFTVPEGLEIVINPETEAALGIEFPPAIEKRITRL